METRLKFKARASSERWSFQSLGDEKVLRNKNKNFWRDLDTRYVPDARAS
jgi:hypothetical protein